MEENIQKVLSTLKDDLDGTFDERARADYAKAVAQMYATSVKQEELEQQAQMKADEEAFKKEELKASKSKATKEMIVRILESVLRFGGTVVAALIPAFVYRWCWKEGLLYEKEGVFTYSGVKDLIRKLRPN